MPKFDITRTELVLPGKYDEDSTGSKGEVVTWDPVLGENRLRGMYFSFRKNLIDV